MKKKGFTLIELLVVIAIIAMLLAILMPALSKVKKIAQRVVCGTNLKGLGTAQTVYAHDYEDQYTVAGFGQVRAANNNVTNATGGFNNPAKPRASWAGGASVGASLYLLVREADVSPKSFVCPGSAQTVYDGRSGDPALTPDITEMWDFGHHGVAAIADTGPVNCVSYSIQHPYSTHAASATKSASFAVMADKNPWHDPKLPGFAGDGTPADAMNWEGRVGFLSDDWTNPAVTIEKWRLLIANAQPHGREGQNVLFADGHNSYEKRTDVGIKHDAIYTPQTANHIRQGGPVSRAAGHNNTNVPVGVSDSFLVNDTNF